MANMVTSMVTELVDRVTHPVRRIQRSLSGLAQQAGLGRMTPSTRRVGASMGTVTVMERTRGLGERLRWMGGIVANAGTERLVSGITDLGNEVKNTATWLQVGSTWLQQWQYVGRQFGVQNDALVEGMKELSMRADEFVITAGGPVADAFKRLGIGLENLRKTGGRTEAILTPEEIENSREYTRQMGNLRTVLLSIQTAVVGNLLPAINRWIERMGALGQASREAIASDIVDGIRNIWRGMRMVSVVAVGATDAIRTYGKLIAIVADLIAGRFLVSAVMASYQLGVFALTAGKTAVKGLMWLGSSLLSGGKCLLAFARVAMQADAMSARMGIGLIDLATRAVPVAIAGIRVLSLVLWRGMRMVSVVAVGATDAIRRYGKLIAIVADLIAGRFLVSVVMASYQLGVFALTAGKTAVKGLMWLGSSLLSGGKCLLAFARVAMQADAMSARMGIGLTDLATRAVPVAIAGIRALSLVLVTMPIGSIITGVATVAGAVDLIYRNWGDIARWFGEQWSSIKAFFSRSVSKIAVDLLSWTPVDLIYRNWGDIAQWFGEQWSSIKAFFSRGVSKIATDLLSWTPVDLIYRNWGDIAQWFGEQWSSIKAFFSRGASKIAVDLLSWTPVDLIYRNWDGVAQWFGNLWSGMKNFFNRGISDITKDLLAFNPATLLLRGIDAVFELFGARPLTEIGKAWIGGLSDSITERWTALTTWLTGKLNALTGWLPSWAKDRLGLGSMQVPQAGGAPVTEGRPAAVPSPVVRAEVGGELRIVVDAQGRPRVAEVRRHGGMDFNVELGVLGIAP